MAVMTCMLLAGWALSGLALGASSYALTNVALAEGQYIPPMWYFEDVSNQLTLAEVRERYTQNQFHQVAPGFNAGVSKPHYWFRVLVDVSDRYDANQHPLLYLDVQDPIFNFIDIYHFKNGQQIGQVTVGSLLPFSQRPFPAPTFVLPFQPLPGESHEFWLRVSTPHSMHMPLRIVTPERLASSQIANTYFYGSLLGMTFIMACYNLLMGWRVRNFSYLFFVGVLIAGIFQRLHASGLGMQLFWSDMPQINPYLRPMMDDLLAFFSVLFTQHFLNTRVFAPLLHRCLNWLVIWAGLAALSVFVLPEKIALYIALWTLLIAFLVQYAVGIDCWLNNIRHAKLFLLGWFVFVSGGVILVFASLGALPLNHFTIHAAEIGLAIQVLALSFALSDRINTIEQEKAEAQQKTVESMTRFRELYENSIDGLFEMLPDGSVRHMNPAFIRMLGIENGNPKHSNLWTFFASMRDQEALKMQVARSESVLNMECELILPSAEKIWVIMSLIPALKAGERHYDGVLRDISESKAKEDALRAQRAAEAATTAKSAFLANMSHEIRTPLTAIIGFAEDARDPVLKPREREQCMDTVIRSSYHLLDIINDVLDLSKIEAGKLELESINVDLLEFLADIQSVFAKRISAKGLEFKIEPQLPLPRYFTADPTRLKQIVLNLLGNALKFTERGNVTLVVEYDQSFDHLLLKVKDTGIGISQDQQNKIFDAFTQAEISTARNYGGTGLGLNIVRHLLDLMGGTIAVESQLDMGSTFTVTLPAHVKAGVEMIINADRMRIRQTVVDQVVIPRLDGQVLYAEDNPVNQMLVRNLVQRTGASIDIVKNGAEAMLYALRHQPAVILMDISMPVISGVTAAKLLRSHGYQGIMVACTANVMSSEVEHYLSIGFDACLEKPIRRERFFDVLARFLPRHANAAGE